MARGNKHWTNRPENAGKLRAMLRKAARTRRANASAAAVRERVRADKKVPPRKRAVRQRSADGLVRLALPPNQAAWIIRCLLREMP